MRSLLKNWRQILLAVALGLFVYLAYQQRHELINVQSILWQGNWTFFVLAMVLQIVFYAFQAAMYHQILQIWLPVGFRDIFKLTLSSNSLNKLLPSGGMSGLALFIAQARENGVGIGLSLISNAFFYSLDYLSFLLIVWWGLFFYGSSIGLGSKARLAITIFTLVIVLATILLLLAIYNQTHLKKWLNALARRMPCLDAKTPALREALGMLENKQPHMLRALNLAFLYAFVMQILDIAILYLCFQTVHYPIKAGSVVAGFGLSSVIALISMVPQGIGIYETAMSWIFNQMGVSFAIAITVALLYRGITFWFAIIPGLFTMRVRKGKSHV